MPSFEEALAASLNGVNTNFEKAVAELHAEVAAASKGIEKLSGGQAALTLHKIIETELSVMYSLNLSGSAQQDLAVAFLVDTKSYPILTAPMHILMNPSLRQQTLELKNKEEVQAFLLEMASNPDSPLVVRLAFILRRKDPK